MIPSAFKKRAPFSDIQFRDPSWIEHKAFTHGLPMAMVEAKPILRTESALVHHRATLDFTTPCVEINTVRHALNVVLCTWKPHYYKLPTGWRVLVPAKE